MKIKMKVPFQQDLGDGTRSHTMYMEVTGERVGPFVVHRSIRNKTRWSVTHIKTGYQCGDSPEKQSAKVSAERMTEMADWEFDDAAVVKSWDPKVIEEIRLIMTIASHGALRELLKANQQA